MYRRYRDNHHLALRSSTPQQDYPLNALDDLTQLPSHWRMQVGDVWFGEENLLDSLAKQGCFRLEGFPFSGP